MTPDPISLLRDLVAIESVNPDLVAGGKGEATIGDFCARWFAANGLEVHRLEKRPGRPSIVGIARGSGGGKSLMFNGHYDTVTLAGYAGNPLDATIRDGKLYGRGSFDMKGGVAAMMIAALRAKASNLAGDILVACVADEEYASTGTQEVVEHFRADAAIVTEPSHLELTLAHRGFIWFDVIVTGRAAHGSRPELGIDAITKAGKFLVALEAYGENLRAKPRHPLLHSGSVHASLIKGGEELSSYPAECRISLERRTIPGETTQTVQAELQELINTIAAQDHDFTARIEPGLERSPFEISQASPIVQLIDTIATQKLRRKPHLRGEPFWTDCALLQAAGIPCLMFGADGGGAHAATEWVTLESLDSLTDILTQAAIEWCR